MAVFGRLVPLRKGFWRSWRTSLWEVLTLKSPRKRCKAMRLVLAPQGAWLTGLGRPFWPPCVAGWEAKVALPGPGLARPKA